MAEWFWKKKGLQTAALILISVSLVLVAAWIIGSHLRAEKDDPVEIVVRRNDQYGNGDNNYALIEAYHLNRPKKRLRLLDISDAQGQGKVLVYGQGKQAGKLMNQQTRCMGLAREPVLVIDRKVHYPLANEKPCGKRWSWLCSQFRNQYPEQIEWKGAKSLHYIPLLKHLYQCHMII